MKPKSLNPNTPSTQRSRQTLEMQHSRLNRVPSGITYSIAPRTVAACWDLVRLLDEPYEAARRPKTPHHLHICAFCV